MHPVGPAASDWVRIAPHVSRNAPSPRARARPGAQRTTGGPQCTRNRPARPTGCISTAHVHDLHPVDRRGHVPAVGMHPVGPATANRVQIGPHVSRNAPSPRAQARPGAHRTTRGPLCTRNRPARATGCITTAHVHDLHPVDRRGRVPAVGMHPVGPATAIRVQIGPHVSQDAPSAVEDRELGAQARSGCSAGAGAARGQGPRGGPSLSPPAPRRGRRRPERRPPHRPRPPPRAPRRRGRRPSR